MNTGLSFRGQPVIHSRAKVESSLYLSRALGATVVPDVMHTLYGVSVDSALCEWGSDSVDPLGPDSLLHASRSTSEIELPFYIILE